MSNPRRIGFPHWQQESVVTFVTFRLADSLPAELLNTWRHERLQWLSHHPEPWDSTTESEYHSRFSGTIERWADEGHGACILRDPAIAAVVGGALNYFEGDRYHQLTWVVMPNHVHAVFVPKPPWTLGRLLQSWKSYTSHEIHRLRGTSGPVWQTDYFDRLVRDHHHFERIVRYIRSNPEKAGLRQGQYLVWESPMAAEVE